MAQAAVSTPRCSLRRLWAPAAGSNQGHPASRAAYLRRRHEPQVPAAAAPSGSQAASAAKAATPGAAVKSLDAGSLGQLNLQGTVVVAGAGPAGLAAAVALHRAGVPVLVLEREAALSSRGTALGLWTNAWRALDALGAAETLRRQHPQVQDIELVRHSGRRLRRFGLGDCDGGPHEFRGVRRSNLLAALAAQLPPSSIAFGAQVAAAEPTPHGAALTLTTGQKLDCLALVGADGARSTVATAAGRRPANYCGQSAVRGVARFPEGLPPQMQAGCIRQVWGPAARAGTYPVSDTELYWFVCFNAPAAAATSSSPEAWRQEALGVVRGWAWGLPEVVQATPLENLTRSRLVDRWDPPPSSSAASSSSITLAGDSLHPMTPNLGQGGCTALEDAVVLARCMQQQRVAQLAAELAAGDSATGQQAVAVQQAVQAAMGRYEGERAQRCLPLTVRSHVMGALLQAPLPPVALARDVFVERAFSPAHFLDHAAYDCGRLDG